MRTNTALQLFIAIISMLVIYSNISNAQCTNGVIQGNNLVTNGDFSQDYTGWTHDVGYAEFTPCASCYSVPSKIYVGSQASKFNPGGFTDFSDHSPSADGKMLMVDGTCTLGIPLWSQSGIPLLPNTSYYFEVWITAMSSPTPHGSLQFDIGGTNYATVIQPTNTIGQWTLFSITYTTNASPPATTTISIENTETTGCQNAVDFAIDDISFTPGCAYSTVGPNPDLGPDRTICGTTNLTLNGGVPMNGTTTVTWVTPLGTYTGTGTGAGGAPYTVGPGTSPVTTGASQLTPGTYTVCVKDGASCLSTDVIVLSGTYSINLGPPITLCDPATAALDAKYTGPGVTYQWYKNGTAAANKITGATAKTYTATGPGTYYVIVNDPICGSQTGSVLITTTAATPVNATFCGTAKGGTGLANLSVTGSGKYKWWSAPTLGTELKKGSTYTPSALAGPGPYTYYVEDTTTFKLTVGPPATGNGFTNIAGGGIASSANNGKLYFNALHDFIIDSITVLPYIYSCPGSPANAISMQVKDGNGAVIGTSSYTLPAPCVTGTPTAPVKVKVGIFIPQGTGYSINNAGSVPVALYLNTTNSGAVPSPELYHYPTTYSSLVTFSSNDAQTFNLYNSPDAIPGYFDWKITKFVDCERVPVVATEVCPLPVSYISFEAITISGIVKLSWETAEEKNSDYFSVERSEDGIHFFSLGTVKAQGNSNGILPYYFTDRSPVNGTSYYRIREADIDGSSTYTEIRSVTLEQRDIMVHPNPNQGSFNVSLKSDLGDHVTLNLINTFGQSVYKNSGTSASEVFEKNMNISSLSSGVYFLEVMSGNNRWVKKIIKE